MNKKVLIVGGVAGGASAAARLRRLDENCEIIMFEKGAYISFANCGLPYYIGGAIKETSKLTLQTPDSFHARFNIDVRINNEVIAIDKAAKTVTVKNTAAGETYTESYDKLILAPGAEPVRPAIEGIDSDRVFTLRSIPDTYKIKDYIESHKPKSAVVVGGGYIGVEMAENLAAAGLYVTIVEMANQVIGPIDYDIACDVHNHILGKGVGLMLGNAVTQIKETDGSLAIKLNDGQLSADMLIMAIGVRPESRIAKETGLLCNEYGAIVADEHMRTSDENIYAAGDAVEITEFITGQKALIPLAGPANKQGRICADNICGIPSVYTGTQGSAILKVFDMTVAATGINEKTAKKQGLDYDKVFLYSTSHAGYYPGAVNMSIKVLFEKTSGKILGAQLAGYDGTDKRCDVLATAIRFGATYEDLTKLELCYAPPFSSAKDPVNMAGYVIENVVTGKVKNFHWHDVADLQKRSDVTLLDTRTVLEYDSGHIDGFINIPLDELRGRLSELDKTKPAYVHCQSGLRSYIACRILSQNGFDCYNLSGGYRLYHSIMGTHKPKKEVTMDIETQRVEETKKNENGKVIHIDACGLQCPGPIVKLGQALKEADVGDTIEISTTDPAFASDIEGFCRRTGHAFDGMTSDKGVSIAKITKAAPDDASKNACGHGNGKNFIVFSGDLDKAIASFIMANAAAAMGRKVSMFFTFWGLNILRKPEKVNLKKDFMSRMFGLMMPRGSARLALSKMNMGGMGAKMIRRVMKTKHIDSLEDLIRQSQQNGVELIACAMSMDVMGIKLEELMDGVKTSGAAAMLAFAEESDMSLFI